MGGGVSVESGNGGSMDQIIAKSAMIGRAFAALTFPDLYRIQDFHSKGAEPLDKEEAPALFAAIFGNGNVFSDFFEAKDDDDDGKAAEQRKKEAAV